MNTSRSVQRVPAYLFQKAGDSNASAVNISRRPSSMQTVSTTRPKELTASKFSTAPWW